MRPCGEHLLKLCINSHVAYHIPLRAFFLSLSAARFERYADVLVMLGGSPEEALPHVLPLVELVPELNVTPEVKVVVVRTKANAFDYHGLSLLYRYRVHPLVRADTYVYCHDTTTVDVSSFVERFEVRWPLVRVLALRAHLSTS